MATIHGLHEDGGVSFLAMELIDGRSLRTAMSDRIELEAALEVALQVARALAAAHEADIVHRDLKPENVMLREDGYAKVLDFGLAQLVQGQRPDPEASTMLTQEGALVGTVPYMSPEQCRGAQVTSASDVFSLGVVLYELFAGRHPFRADSLADSIQRTLSEAPLSPSRLNPSLTGELEALILETLNKEAKRRPGAGEIARRLTEWTGSGSRRRSRPESGESPLLVVGRDEQERALAEVLAQASTGRARVACVSGEPGIGKTTIVEDFLRRLVEEGESCFVARGRCSERLAGTEAYLPLLEVLEDLLRGPRGEQVRRVMEQVAPSCYIRTVPLSSGEHGGVAAIEDARASSQERLKRELLGFLQELSQTAPVLLFVDDLHWADASTVDLLAYIGARPDGLGLLIVGTYRLSDLLLGDHPFVGVKRDLLARGVASEIALGFLSEEDVARFLSLEFPGNAFPDALASFVHARTEGNALFMVNLIRYLREVEAIVDRKGWCLVKPIASLDADLPESIRSMIERKIEQLAPEDRRLLVTASVQGAEFHASVVAEALGADEAEVEESLDRLARVHALVRVLDEEELPDGSLTVRCGFVHALYQNALYAELTPPRRAAQSAAVATAWLRRRAGDTTAVANELGVLFEAARDFGAAADSFLEAADKAGRIHANEEAIELSRRSLRNAERLPGGAGRRRVHDAALHLAVSYTTIAQFGKAVDSFILAESVAEELADHEARVQAICGRAIALCYWHRIDDMRAEASRAADLARSTNSPVGLAYAESVLASERLCLGDLAEAESHFERSIPVLLASPLQAQVVQGFTFKAGLHTWRLEYAEGHRIAGAGLAKARELGSTFDILGVHFFSGMMLGNEGRLGEALATVGEACRLAELNQTPYWLSRLPNTLAWLHQELGDRESALALNLENIELAREHGMAEGEANSHLNLARTYLSLSECDRAHEHLRCAERIHESDVWFRWRHGLRLRAEFAKYWMARGDLDEARASAEACREAAKGHQSPKYLAVGSALLGEIAMKEDDVVAAASLFDESLGILSTRRCPVAQWRVLRSRSELAERVSDSAGRDNYRGQARAIVDELARSVPDEQVRERFLKSKAVRDL